MSTFIHGVRIDGWKPFGIDSGMDFLVGGLSYLCKSQAASGGLHAGPCSFGAGRDYVEVTSIPQALPGCVFVKCSVYYRHRSLPTCLDQMDE